MKKNIAKYCRELISLVFSVYSVQIPPFLGTLTLLILPAFLYGCDAPQASPDYNHGTVTRISMDAVRGQIGEIDIFIFKNDRMQHLDCYQKITDLSSWNKEIVSSSGERIITACSNSRKTAMDWAAISSLSYFRNLSISLEEESMEHPFMSGYTDISASTEEGYASLTLRPLTSMVELRSIRCDFTGRPYEGELLEDARVYLTNVSAECRILAEDEIMPVRIINAGQLREEEVNALAEPELLFRDLGTSIGKITSYPDIRFLCYPNNAPAESPGSPFTRLVIEGKVKGETFYWPLDINRDDGRNGIGRNEKYIFDITITRKGTKDPDTPVKAEEIDIIFNIETWNEKKDYEVLF